MLPQGSYCTGKSKIVSLGPSPARPVLLVGEEAGDGECVRASCEVVRTLKNLSLSLLHLDTCSFIIVLITVSYYDKYFINFNASCSF